MSCFWWDGLLDGCFYLCRRYPSILSLEYTGLDAILFHCIEQTESMAAVGVGRGDGTAGNLSFCTVTLCTYLIGVCIHGRRTILYAFEH
jgi:hypothetical protein